MNDTTMTKWTGMIPVEDTALALTDTGGSGAPLVYLNGSYATQKDWKPVIAELRAGFRHITYDERARGKSKRSADYTFEATVRDLDAVLEARRVDKPILVGWSYGAALAAHWAARNPDRVAGIVSVDGAYPYDSLGNGDVTREEIRRLFGKMRLLLPFAALVGKAARMSADQHAEINIEINELLAKIGPVLDKVAVPMLFVVAEGAHLGGNQQVMRRVRASLAPVLARNPNIKVSSTVTSNHEHIVRKDYRAIAQAVREVAAIHRKGTPRA